MRLLYFNDAGQLCLTANLNGDSVPEYAIISHTWGPDKDEVTFEDMINNTGENKPGYRKIRRCGEQARQDGLQHFWVDTCCIDKRSSSELSESINSMYSWYKQSQICYAYIDDWPSELSWTDLASIIPADDEDEDQEDESEDVRSTKTASEGSQSDGSESDEMELGSNEGEEIKHKSQYISESSHIGNVVNKPEAVNDDSEMDALHHSVQSTGSAQNESSSPKGVSCRWFTRGWTLQELIAPDTLEFFDGNWRSRGMKSDSSVVDNLSRITGITASILSFNHELSLQDICIGQRMSWAAYRVTSRVEDIAYCLLGIFQINMPLLYGEGAKAFSRLQEEILRSSTDLSLLAWSQAPKDAQQYRGILSQHPREFRALSDCQLDDSQFSIEDEIIMTNRGARVETSLFYIRDNYNKAQSDHDVYFLSVGCLNKYGYLQGILLSAMKGFFVRARPNILVKIDKDFKRTKAQTIYLARDLDGVSSLLQELDHIQGTRVRFQSPRMYVFRTVKSWPHGYFDPSTSTFLIARLTSFIGYLRITISNDETEFSPYPSTPFAHFMAVVCKGIHSDVSITFLRDHQAEEFARYTKLVAEMDSRSAHETLVSKIFQMRQNSEPIVVQDHENRSLLRVEGKIDEHEMTPIPDLTVSPKGVKVVLIVDS